MFGLYPVEHQMLLIEFLERPTNPEKFADFWCYNLKKIPEQVCVLSVLVKSFALKPPT